MVYLNDLLLFLSVGSIDEPTSCPTCQALASMELIHNRCLFSDKQCIRVQETPDEIPEGETPTTISLVFTLFPLPCLIYLTDSPTTISLVITLA